MINANLIGWLASRAKASHRWLSQLRFHKTAEELFARRVELDSVGFSVEPITNWTMSSEENLSKLGITLHPAPPGVGAYIPWTRMGNWVLTSGQLPWAAPSAAWAAPGAPPIRLHPARGVHHIAPLLDSRESPVSSWIHVNRFTYQGSCALKKTYFSIIC